MSEAVAKPAAATEPGNDAGARSRVRKAAEWVSFGMSVLLILGLSGFLVREGLREEPPFVPAEVRAVVNETRLIGEQFVLPIEVKNAGGRALTSLEIEATYTASDGKEETQELNVDYLGEGSEVRIFLYLDRDPRRVPVNVRAAHYQSE